MNRVVLCGRLTADPEIRETASGMKVGRYTLAVDRRGKDGGADFIQCICFEKSADFAAGYFKKGQRVLISGRWQTGSYEGKDGKKVYTNECYVQEQEFADSKQGSISEHKPAEKPEEGFMDIPDNLEDEGLPFR